ncbi:hypothetical protein [Streptomyces sp. enrichment culture]|uniref:hypothetical protein n=1 Tax=Streptomyces sp. enrichment culture TaxID=1795815 RepID=UPI003F551F91
MHPERYHLVLLLDGRPTMHGWWADEAVARRKVASWIGAYGQAGARVTLTDEETGTVLTEWPDQG